MINRKAETTKGRVHLHAGWEKTRGKVQLSPRKKNWKAEKGKGLKKGRSIKTT